MCVAKTASSSLGDEESVRNFVPPPGTVRKPACPARCLSGFCGLKWNAYTSAVRRTSRTNLSSVDVNICRRLFKSEFKEVQSYGRPVGRHVCAERPTVISVENAPGFEMSDRALHRGAQPVYLCIEFLLPV